MYEKERTTKKALFNFGLFYNITGIKKITRLLALSRKTIKKQVLALKAYYMSGLMLAMAR